MQNEFNNLTSPVLQDLGGVLVSMKDETEPSITEDLPESETPTSKQPMKPLDTSDTEPSTSEIPEETSDTPVEAAPTLQ